MGCYLLLQGNLPDPGIKPLSLASSELAGRFFTTEPPETDRKNKTVVCALISTLILSYQSPTLITSFNLNHLLLGPPPNIVTVGVTASTCEFWGTQFSPHQISFHPCTHPIGSVSPGNLDNRGEMRSSK